MRLDIERSLVLIGERSFPAVGLICPCDRDELAEPWDRLLGGPGVDGNSDWDVYIPLENGCMIELGWSESRAKSWAYVVTNFCILHTMPSNESSWLPEHLDVDGLRLIMRFNQHIGADEDWLVEWIERVARKQSPSCFLHDGKFPQMISLKDTWTLHKEHARV